MLDRRDFLKHCGLALTVSSAGGRALASPRAIRPVLVTVFQRGGLDGLMAAPPLEPGELRRLRPRLVPSGLLDLGNGFGLHPALADLMPLWRQGRLALVHGIGSPLRNSSHAQAQGDWESGAPGRIDLPEGWRRRLLAELGETPAIGPAAAGLAASEIPYPAGALGRALQQAAAAIKAGAAPPLIAVESGGWDHHVGQARSFAERAKELGRALAAFDRDLGDRRDDVVLLTHTEFGRSAAENGTGGTDHGHGSCSFLLGGRVAGGRIYGIGLGASAGELLEGPDLGVRTDFRSVLAELATRHLGAPRPDRLFPGFSGLRLPLLV